MAYKKKKKLNRFIGDVNEVYENEIAQECKDFSANHPGREISSDLPRRKIRKDRNCRRGSKEW